MPYDPRPTTEGGNRGIDIEFSRKAPEGKFRVVGVDTFSGDDWVERDCDTLEEARKVADEEGGTMTKMHVYDDTGKHLYDAGTI